MNTKTKTCLQCSEEIFKRGLCGTCYSRYRNAMLRLETSKRKVFEQALIDGGKLLPAGKRQPSSYDPFAELADKLETAKDEKVGQIIADFQTKQNKSQKQTVQQEADDVVRKAKKAARRKGITPKDKPN